ncbi:MAG: sugar ABC transporter ATP-binding protein [Eubacteriales bacterium]|nr:sugar ABC transporter ATP-binding protein [Eubacteriales bacterium]
MNEDIILEIKHITKQFPGVKALDDVSLQVKRGSVHALVGENGAGKSTLIKVLTGIYVRYEGEIWLNGEKVSFETPSQAKAKGISVVHQELKLSEPLSVTENIFLGNLLKTKAGFVDWKSMNSRAQKLVDSLGVEINVHARVSSLTVAKKQIVEICKSIMHNCKILIMDEPSATLTNKELEILFRIIKKLKNDGTTIIYISHRLEEVFHLADEISVLRDGIHVATVSTDQIDKNGLVRMMVGREVNAEYPRSGVVPGDVVFAASHIVRKDVLKDISFEVRRGEILGIAGLVGAGRTELVRAILGIDKMDSGEVLLSGKPVRHKEFISAIKNGFGLVPEDRKLQGVTLGFSIKANVCMTDLKKITRHGIIRSGLENRYAQEFSKKLRIVAPSIDTAAEFLSGGNQQKIVIAKWLFRDSKILIMDEPTRGIDVGAKREIYDLICNLAKQGKTIVMISSELPELLGICDRVIVIHEGRLVGELTHEEATQDRVMSLCV